MKRRIAIFGCGAMARTHARDLLEYDGFDLVAASDPIEPARAAMRKDAPGITLYEDSDELLRKEKPELVVVGTRAGAHAKLSVAALRAGAHVLCEKPLTVTVEEADRIVAAAKEAGRLALVDHQFRVNPRSLAAVRLVRAGAIGEVRSMYCAGKGRFGGWEHVETGTHLFDLALLFGGKPEWVTGHMYTGHRLATEDDIVDPAPGLQPTSGPVVGERVYFAAGFDRGAVLRADFFDASSTNFLLLSGTKGALHVPLGAAQAKPFINPKPFANPNQAEGWKEVPVEWGPWGEKHNFYAYDLWRRWIDSPDDPEVKASAIDGRHPMDVEFGRTTMEMIHGAFESHFQGGARVPLPLERRDHPLARRQRRRQGQPA